MAGLYMGLFWASKSAKGKRLRMAGGRMQAFLADVNRSRVYKWIDWGPRLTWARLEETLGSDFGGRKNGPWLLTFQQFHENVDPRPFLHSSIQRDDSGGGQSRTCHQLLSPKYFDTHLEGPRGGWESG